MSVYLTKGVTYSTVIDLRTGNDGIYLSRDGWPRAVARRNEDGTWPKSVFETMTISVDGTSHYDVASTIQTLDTTLREGTDHALEPLDENPVYLRTKLTNESTSYQTLVLSGGTEPATDYYSPPMDPGNYLSSHIIAIERTPFWEPESSTSVVLSSVVSTGDMARLYASGTSINGDVPARLEITRFRGVSGGGGPLTEFWIGFRTNRLADATYDQTYFESVWLCQNGTASNNTTLDVADATALGGAKSRWTPAGGSDDNMLTRVTIRASDLTATHAVAASVDPQAQRSRNLVLLRAKSTGTGTFRVRIQSGFYGGDNWKTGARALVNSSSWYYYPMGTVDIPPLLYQPNWRTFIGQSAIRIQAELGAGTSSLDMDALIMIPQAEGAIYAKGGSVQYSSTGAVSYVEISSNAADIRSGIAYDTTNSQYEAVQIDPSNYALPNGPVVTVFAAQRSSTQGLTDSPDIHLHYFTRWLNLRGSE